MSRPPDDAASGKSRAATVAAGILASRLAGFVRQMVTARFFGVTPHADVLALALRGPNVLQNLLGEGTLSAAFIPIYSRLLRQGRAADAGRFAGAVLGLLLALVAALVLVGVLLAPLAVTVLSPGLRADAAAVAAGELSIDRFELTVQGFRIILPMTGILVLSAWALAVLNSHRRFFLPYVAPVLWNAAIVGALFWAGWRWLPQGPEAAASSQLTRVLVAAFVGALVGGLLQFLVQLPLVFRELTGFRLSFSARMPEVREALRAFGPVVAGRGAYQLSTWLDLFLAGWLAAGAYGALLYGQTLYLLPISLFAMSVAASELPELSRLDSDEVPQFLARLDRSLRQILFLTVPTLVGYLLFALPIVRGLFERGEFDLEGSWLVALVLAAYTVGLLATTTTRLFQNAFYALHDTRTPARVAVLRLVTSGAAAVPLMLWLDRVPAARFMAQPPEGGGERLFLGAVGLALGTSLGAWLELVVLHARLRRRLPFRLPAGAFARMFALAGAAGAAVLLAGRFLPDLPPEVRALALVGSFAAAYLAVAALGRFPELAAWTGRLRRR